MKYLSPDVRIVKELPKDLQILDLEAIGSVVSFTFSPNLDPDKSHLSSLFVHVLSLLIS